MSKILIVDDIEDNVKLLEFDLEEEGYEIFGAYSGEEAITKAKELTPDLIILDIMMPKLDGIETCKILKNDPKLADIPIVMMSAKNQTSDIIKALDAGASDYITKPINYPIVAARIRSAMRTRQLTRAACIESGNLSQDQKTETEFKAQIKRDILEPLSVISELGISLAQEIGGDQALLEKSKRLASTSANLINALESMLK